MSDAIRRSTLPRVSTMILGLGALAATSHAASVPPNVALLLAASPPAPLSSAVTMVGETMEVVPPPGTLHVTLAYDGNDTAGAPGVNIQFRDSLTGQLCWFLIDKAFVNGVYGGSNISTFGTKIHTYELDIGVFEPTGLVVVSGVVPNGIVDGLAFGLVWRDANGGYRMLKSNTRVSAARANYWGAWPLSMAYSTLQARTPQLDTCGSGELCRRDAQAALWGSQLLLNGIYHLNRTMHRIAAQ